MLKQLGCDNPEEFIDKNKISKYIPTTGTIVIFLGNSNKEETFCPESQTAASWIAKQLNTRYFGFPEGISIKCLSTTVKQPQYRHATGQKYYLDHNCKLKGDLILNAADVKIHWWILNRERTLFSNIYYNSGHLGILWNNELFDVSIKENKSVKLQQFGILFGYNRVVIYIEPMGTRNRVTTNTSRTNILIDNQPIDYGIIARDFRRNMPTPIRNFVAEEASNNDNNSDRIIQRRIRKILDLFPMTHYGKSEMGEIMTSTGDDMDVKSDFSGDKDQLFGGNNGQSGENVDMKPGQNAPELIQNINGDINAKRFRNIAYPTVRWISRESGTREPGDMPERAARYLSEQNVLLINGDFSMFKILTKIWKEKYCSEGVESVIQNTSKVHWEQSLIETVLGIKSQFKKEDYHKLLSEEALTASIQSRYYLNIVIRTELSKIGDEMTTGSLN
ncbi:MAG: hypothetical protein HQK54_15425 [Oligoflexales bacterium]|nr:hypothetical protein [Oligoflexales bacterium]